jgi:hypothetical protein
MLRQATANFCQKIWSQYYGIIIKSTKYYGKYYTVNTNAMVNANKCYGKY